MSPAPEVFPRNKEGIYVEHRWRNKWNARVVVGTDELFTHLLATCTEDAYLQAVALRQMMRERQTELSDLDG